MVACPESWDTKKKEPVPEGRCDMYSRAVYKDRAGMC